jgi:glycosyltransferase involved in cell wall biosynthesis
MKIAIAYSKFSRPKVGGAKTSLRTLLEYLSRKMSFSADIFQVLPSEEPTMPYDIREVVDIESRKIPHLVWVDKVYQRYQWSSLLNGHLSKSYDLIIVQDNMIPAVVRATNSEETPILSFVRSLVSTGWGKYDTNRTLPRNFLATDIGGKVQFPFLVKNSRQYKRSLQESTTIIANSQFTSSKLSEQFDIKPTVVYPPIDIDKYRIDYDESGDITLVNPRAPYKGCDLFLNIAASLPEERFLIAGEIHSQELADQAAVMDNVTHVEWFNDMRKAYGRTKILLVPSKHHEPFGRVAAEAMISGIPCVVSEKGGLPEVIGETGEIVSEIESVDRWIKAIQRVRQNHEPQRQIERAKGFSVETQGDRFHRIVESAIRNE